MFVRTLIAASILGMPALAEDAPLLHPTAVQADGQEINSRVMARLGQADVQHEVDQATISAMQREIDRLNKQCPAPKK